MPNPVTAVLLDHSEHSGNGGLSVDMIIGGITVRFSLNSKSEDVLRKVGDGGVLVDETGRDGASVNLGSFSKRMKYRVPNPRSLKTMI